MVLIVAILTTELTNKKFDIENNIKIMKHELYNWPSSLLSSDGAQPSINLKLFRVKRVQYK